MYNMYQFLHQKQDEERERQKTIEQLQYLNKREEYKRYASEVLKKKSVQFLQKQLTSENPFIFEDQHFQRWRNHRPCRDIQDPAKFKGGKVFKYRPNSDMGKYYEERQRKQMRYLAQKKQDLVKSGLIPPQQISRSQISQGPYNPKISFREIKKDKEYFQPHLKFANITDQQKFKSSHMQLDQRLNSIYQKYVNKKLKQGEITTSITNRFKVAVSLNTKTPKLSQKSRKIIQIEDPQLLNEQSGMIMSKCQKKSKRYFKLAKMMQMFHPEAQKRERFMILLNKSQFSRKKDLTNILNNSYNENFVKHAIV